MVSGLLDTSVIIDYLRGYDPSFDWLQKQSALGITPIVWLETIENSPSKQI
jgi:predicted nucleic acid-binding protein